MRDVIALIVESLGTMVVVVVAVALIKQLNPRAKGHAKNERESRTAISPFFRYTSVIIGIFCVIESIAILINDLVFVLKFGENYAYILRLIIVICALFSFTAITILYLGRLYFSFHNTAYTYPKQTFIVLIISIFIALIFGIIAITLYYINQQQYQIIWSTSFAIGLLGYLSVSTIEVLLFVNSTNKV